MPTAGQLDPEDLLQKYGFIHERFADEKYADSDNPEPSDLTVYLHPDGTRVFLSENVGLWRMLDRENLHLAHGDYGDGSLEAMLKTIYPEPA